MTEQTSPTVANDQALQLEVAQLIVEALNLEIPAADIAPDAPLYGDGLGLDSIDILEISLVISKRYGLQLRADDQDNQSFFSSLGSLTTYIASQRTR
ncbi:MAG: phosphopantetheine-binding protein [Rhodoferax sp.]